MIYDHIYSECIFNARVDDNAARCIFNDILKNDPVLIKAKDIGLITTLESGIISGTYEQMHAYLIENTSFNEIYNGTETIKSLIQSMTEYCKNTEYENTLIDFMHIVFNAYVLNQPFLERNGLLIVFASEDDYLKFKIIFP